MVKESNPRQDNPERLTLTTPFEMEFVRIPVGEFLMGSDPIKDKLTRDIEQPQHIITLPEYYIAKYPITNEQFVFYLQKSGEREASEAWTKRRTYLEEEAQRPVTYIVWYDAIAFCQWLSKESGQAIRLPTEAEWEKAARGTDGRIWPWGNKWDLAKCNSWESWKEGGVPTPIGQYSPQGDSPYGVADIAGNVWEWTISLWGTNPSEPDFKYPYNPDDSRENLEAGSKVLRVIRGGSFHLNQHYARCAFRGWGGPFSYFEGSGFRVVLTSPHQSSLFVL